MACETNTDDAPITLGDLVAGESYDRLSGAQPVTLPTDFAADDRDTQALDALAGIYNFATPEMRETPEFMQYLAKLATLTTGAEFPLWRRLTLEVGSTCQCGVGHCEHHTKQTA